VRFFYNLLTYLLYLPYVGYWLVRGVTNRAYLHRLGERLGIGYPRLEGCIWIHAVSVGEVVAAVPLIRALGKRYPGRPLLVASAAGGATEGTRQAGVPRRMSPRSVYRRLKRVFAAAADELDRHGRAREATNLRRASTHWLRHTFGSRAVAAGVPLDVVRESMGHASLATTSVYLHSSAGRRVRELARMAAMAAAPAP
jgi:integrase